MLAVEVDGTDDEAVRVLRAATSDTLGLAERIRAKKSSLGRNMPKDALLFDAASKPNMYDKLLVFPI